MGLNIGKGLKKLGKGLKKVASVANPVFGVGYDLIAGKNLKEAGANFVGNNMTKADISAKLLPVAIGMGAPGAASIPGMSSIAGGGAAAGSAAGGAAPAAASAGGWRSVLGGAKGVYDKIGGLDTILAGASLVSGLDQQRKADRYNEKALKMQEADYARRAPLRSDDVLQGLLNEERPDLSSIYQSSNPFRRVVPRRGR